ncbi:unnamed protein product [Dovyalis caffra]|uniref:Uncharacterized protein n=1 Tax=Dovyalis caffra TaxID=77055 RepID=A0AAV1SMH9_9ROSI|nr:unnamed protein product [Dovyalis caffra]
MPGRDDIRMKYPPNWTTRDLDLTKGHNVRFGQMEQLLRARESLQLKNLLQDHRHLRNSGPPSHQSSASIISE